MKNKLNFLLNDATTIGFYNKCEVIEIFGYKKDKKEAFNIYTLVVFENTQQITIEGLMTDKLQQFRGYKNLSWGIQRRVVEIEIIKKLYTELLENNKYEIDNPLSIGSLKLLQEQYIPPRESMHKAIQINNILKNNFHNGSYILEFFDEDKQNIQFLLDNPTLLNDFSEEVSSILPIKIVTLSDRLGNIIFQLPINSIEIYHGSIVDRTTYSPKFQGFKIEIFPKTDFFDIKNLLIRIYEENEAITRHKILAVKNNITEIYLDDSFGTYIEIIDKNTGLLLYRFRVYLMKYMNNDIHVIEHQKRVFKINGHKEKLQVSTSGNRTTHGKAKAKDFNEWIQDRKYEEELQELENSKAFVQYFGNEKEKALNDVRELINKYGEKGVYLWDPYLTTIDIKNTLYYCKNTYVPMKAISGLQQGSKRLESFFRNVKFSVKANKSLSYIFFDFQFDLIKFQKLSKKQKAKVDMINEFKKDKKEFLFLDLEVKGKTGANGYDFHDRFLIFPLEKAKVWSLGISVNQLGKSHHILQEVKNAQHILNAFNKLWDELNDEECLIWKSK